MTIADEIITGKDPDFDAFIQEGYSLDDTDEYGMTLLIEAVITQRLSIAEELLQRKVLVDKPDVTGRTALHWAIDKESRNMAHLLLENGANPNTYTRGGSSPLVYPILRRQESLKSLLFQYGAKLDFAQDYILAKLIGHRFELEGIVDIITPKREFEEVVYEGFILEFSVALDLDSLRRFTSNFSTRDWRPFFPLVYAVMDAFAIACDLLRLQQNAKLNEEDKERVKECLKAPLHIFPVASEGHAIGFVHFGKWWIKVDRGENSLTEGSINVYEIQYPERVTVSFLEKFLYEIQPRSFFHKTVPSLLGLRKITNFPMSSQITGNCSWANLQATVPVALALLLPEGQRQWNIEQAFKIADAWVEWDQDRALEECIQRFYLADETRKASVVSMLGAILFQSCDYGNAKHLSRAEKILKILTIPEYSYVLKSYIEVYCVRQLTHKGNNLLKILDDSGIDSEVDITPIATGLKKRKKN